MDTLIVVLLVVAAAWWWRRRHGDTSMASTGATASHTGRSAAPDPRQRVRSGVAHFAVVDVETSSLRPKGGRIIEIGIVHLDPKGNVTHRWGTLVNPGDGTAGRTDIHGIKAEWLVAAPMFEQIAGDIVERLRGRVLVAHNAPFDGEWLESEFNRIANPLGDYEALCTMDVAQQLGLPRKLSSAARALGHDFEAHTALADAEAAGRIVHAAIRAGMTGHENGVLRDGALPRGLEPSGLVAHRQQAAEAMKPRPFLTEAMLAADVPDGDRTTHEDSYLDVLERALEDGVLDPAEQQELTGLAKDLGLNHARAMEMHEVVVDAMVEAALDDNRVTAEERREIEQAATWLGVDVSDMDTRVKAARQRIKDAQARFRERMDGVTVAFTGRGGHPKDVREALAASHGITTKTRVTDDTDLLVVGSLQTDNKQTERAAQDGLQVMVEHAFWAKLGATTPDEPAPVSASSDDENPLGFASLTSTTLEGVAAGTYRGRRVHEWADAIRQLRREDRVQDAERVLVGCIQATEAQARSGGVAPFYYQQLAILYSKARRPHDELAVLERYAAQPHAPGATPEKLLARLEKARAKVSE